MEEAGRKLKQARERLNLRFREVEEASTRLATRHGNDEFIVALSRLADIENKGTMPSIYRLYSLCAIYRLDLSEVLSWYGIPLPSLPDDAGLIEHSSTGLVNFQVTEGDVRIPLSLDPGLDVNKTTFLSRLVQKWGSIPLLMLSQIDLKNLRYGLIGTDDWSMHPLIPPGSLVVIDDSSRRIQTSGWTSENDRPIYFFETHDAYVCGWCSLQGDQLTVLPHPSSNCPSQTYDYPEQIELIGRITRVAMSLDHSGRRRAQPA